MGRRQSSELGKREEILAAAQTLFLEKGFDGTSIRSIMKQAGGEIGLFYYYFKSKDEVFDCMLDRFFADYEANFLRIVAHGRRNPCRVMEEFFEYVESATEEFRRQYAPNMHRTVRWAVREHTMEIIEPYLRQVVELQSRYYGVPPAIAPDAAALYLTYGVCSSILHEDAQSYRARRQDIKKGVSLLMGMPMEQQDLRIPFPAQKADLPGCLALWEAAELWPAQDLQCLAERVEAGEVWVTHCSGSVVGALLYSRAHSRLEQLAVAPAWRRRGVGGRLAETMAAQFPVGTVLLAQRPAGPEGQAARQFLRAMGFAEPQQPTGEMQLTVCALSPRQKLPL